MRKNKGLQDQLEEFRARFIHEFDRIGMTGTPEEALFLSILVWTRHAIKGVEVGSANGYGAINRKIGF